MVLVLLHKYYILFSGKSKKKTVFYHPGCLTKRIAIRTGDKPYACEHCCKSYLKTHTDTGVKKHLYIVIKKHLYNQCCKSFSLRSNLLRHMTTHTGVKNHSCSQCGKSFSPRSNLLTHMTTQTGVKNLSCYQCGKSFSRRRNLISHMKIHTGVKKHSCNQCGKGKEQCIQGVRNHLCNQCAASVVRVSSTRKQTGEKLSI